LVLPRDPFRPIEPKKPAATAGGDLHELKPIVLDVPPSEAGLVLSGTIVGPRRSVARMNGKNYVEGDTVLALTSERPLSYRVVEVAGRSVTLALGDMQYELSMPRRGPDPSASAGTGLSENVSSDSPDFDPSILENLN
jgi:hypothetical protein